MHGNVYSLAMTLERFLSTALGRWMEWWTEVSKSKRIRTLYGTFVYNTNTSMCFYYNKTLTSFLQYFHIKRNTMRLMEPGFFPLGDIDQVYSLLLSRICALKALPITNILYCRLSFAIVFSLYY